MVHAYMSRPKVSTNKLDAALPDTHIVSRLAVKVRIIVEMTGFGHDDLYFAPYSI